VTPPEEIVGALLYAAFAIALIIVAVALQRPLL